MIAQGTQVRTQNPQLLWPKLLEPSCQSKVLVFSQPARYWQDYFEVAAANKNSITARATYSGTACSSAAANAPTSSGGNFESFYARFRSVIKRRDHAGLRELMSPKFEWALDGYTTREQALNNIAKIIGWQKFWHSAALALAKPAQACKPHYCNNRSGYETFTKTPFPLEMMFELGPDNQWHWSAVLGD
jgi:hypothetical protein